MCGQPLILQHNDLINFHAQMLNEAPVFNHSNKIANPPGDFQPQLALAALSIFHRRTIQNFTEIRGPNTRNNYTSPATLPNATPHGEHLNPNEESLS